MTAGSLVAGLGAVALAVAAGLGNVGSWLATVLTWPLVILIVVAWLFLAPGAPQRLHDLLASVRRLKIAGFEVVANIEEPKATEESLATAFAASFPPQEPGPVTASCKSRIALPGTSCYGSFMMGRDASADLGPADEDPEYAGDATAELDVDPEDESDDVKRGSIPDDVGDTDRAEVPEEGQD